MRTANLDKIVYQKDLDPAAGKLGQLFRQFPVGVNHCGMSKPTLKTTEGAPQMHRSRNGAGSLPTTSLAVLRFAHGPSPSTTTTLGFAR